jgi:holo-[acyl-carrier protein] synthase
MRKGQKNRHISEKIAHPVDPQVRHLTEPIRIGVDFMSVPEVAGSLARFGERYVRRVFMPGEAAYCQAGRGSAAASRFAARFAAKEAAVKVLRPKAPWTDWRSIEVRRHASGWCDLVLHGEAASLARRQGIAALTLSMTRTADCAVAVVVGRAARATSEEER